MARVLAFGLLLLLSVVSPECFSAQAASREDAFRNFSTAPNFIKVQIEDPESGKRRWTVFESMDFNILLINQWSNLVGKEVPRSEETYTAFIRQRVEELPIEISLSAFADILATQFGSEEAARQYLERYSFERPYSLDELGFSTKQELLEAYFTVHPSGTYATFRNEGDVKGVKNVWEWEARFIALLIDLGFSVGRGDISPIMYLENISSAE